MNMEWEYFVFDYYTSVSRPRSCLVPLRVVNGVLEYVPNFGSTDPQEITLGESERKLMKLLGEVGVREIWSCRGDCMYDEALGFITHYSGGEGKYAFHYDSVVGRGMGDLKVKEFTVVEKLGREEREGRRVDLLEVFCD